MSTTPSSISGTHTRPHILALDGLRGIAALVVVWYHIFEAFAIDPVHQTINHGYLAVDFFFVLSGYVMGYAYDDRWHNIGYKGFALRRLIRLHPMVVLGSILGGLLFYAQGCDIWRSTEVSISSLLVASAMNALLIPATPATEVRGLGEMFPLNGPCWSLFFEYIGNVLYSVLLRKLSTKILGLVVLLLGVGIVIYTTTQQWGYLGVGWQLTLPQFLGGSLRLFFSMGMGLLLSRLRDRWQVSGGWFVATLLLVALTTMPRVGGSEHVWHNALYDSTVVILIFPLLVYLGANDKIKHPTQRKLCQWLGNISYPLYIIHYPFIYLYIAQVNNRQWSFVDSLPAALALFVGCIILAHLCLYLYDLPVRRWLSKHLVP